MKNAADTLWKQYRERVYKTSEPLAQDHERECSLAFFAGMNAAFWTLSHMSTASDDENVGAMMAERFRLDIREAAVKANLDRSDGLS